MLTIREALKEGKLRLASEGLRDAQQLLCHLLEIERSTLYAHPERLLNDAQERAYLELLTRRQQGEPLAYLTGHQEFYGLDFCVDRRVLIPRPETELLVEAALKDLQARFARGETPLVADIGTGSGAIPIALARQEPRLPRLYACDLSPEALEVANCNCQLLNVSTRVQLCQGDLLAALPEPVDLLTANLPYVGTDELAVLTRDVLDFEPHLALFSGPQGLDLLERLLQELASGTFLRPGALILLEIGYQQGTALQDLTRRFLPTAQVVVTPDYAGWDRLVHIQL